MKFIKLFLVLFLSTPFYANSVEFPNANSYYDFTQTTEIFVVNHNESKFFGMIDPFEMVRTTMPSRFYIATMGVIERGQRNVDGVLTIPGAPNGYIYSVIFRSLDRSYIIHVGTNWIVDGNKMIPLTQQEIVSIYDVLKSYSSNSEPSSLEKLNGLFDNIKQNQIDPNGSVSADSQLQSIDAATKSIQERLPESHNDVKTLPYYNKAMENEKFLENEEKLRRLKEDKISLQSKQKNELNAKNELAAPPLDLPSNEISKAKDTTSNSPKATTDRAYSPTLWILLIAALALCFFWIKRR